MKLRIVGGQSTVEAFRKQLEDASNGNWLIGQPSSQALDPFARPQQGMEPITYFIIVFTAHLAAGLVEDMIKELIRKANERGLTASLEEDIGEDEQASAPSSDKDEEAEDE